LPAALAADWSLSATTTLDFMLAPTRTVPGPRKDAAADSTSEDANRPPAGGQGGGDDEDEDPDVDLSVQVEDAAGRVATVRLGAYGAIRRPLETWVMRRTDQEEARFADHWELILQTYSIPLGDFTAANSALDLRRLSAVRFVFDRVHAGEVAIDQIGFSALPSAFLDARVDGR
jgi:hypothetical protein